MKANMNTLKSVVKEMFEAYLAANASVRERAKAHGEALILLRAACAERKLDFVETVKGLGVVVSTAYHHIKLAESWDQAEDMARTMGVEFEAMSITEIIEAVRPRKKPVKTHQVPNTASTSLEVGSANPVSVDTGSLAQSPVPVPAGETICPTDPLLSAAVQQLIEKNLVRVVHGKKGRSIRLKLDDAPILVVPN